MQIRNHSEFNLYKTHEERLTRFRSAISAWRARGEPIVAGETVWTEEKARAFVEDIAALFRAYNLVLWEQFSYCRDCQGGCCVVGACRVTDFDALAMVLLDLQPPRLVPGETVAPDACIYLGQAGCRWPASWRPLKCWAFYCLGSGIWQVDAADERYAAITRALENVLVDHMPELLGGDGGPDESLVTFLADPIAFTDRLGRALQDIIVKPFVDELALPPPSQIDTDEERDPLETFMAEAVEVLWRDAPAAPRSLGLSSEQFLADLEELQWIAEGLPADGPRRLAEMATRYAAAPTEGDAANLWYRMGNHIARLSANWPETTAER